MRAYILSVIAAALVTAVLGTLAGSGPMGKLFKLLAGIFMALTVVSPLLQVEVPDPEAWFASYTHAGQAAAAQGAEMAEEAQQAFIKTQVETYILDKAALYGAELAVEAALDGEGIPVGVTLTGEISPYAKERLVQIIREDLGLGEEAQQWCS